MRNKHILIVLSIVAAMASGAVVVYAGNPNNPPGPPEEPPKTGTIRAGVPKTGQTISYATGDDGDLEMGVEWPDPRFTDNEDGTVTDNLTGLIWLRNAECTVFFSGDSTGGNRRIWGSAIAAANDLATGYCGLTDGSSAGDWRLPNVQELQSLIDYGEYGPALPAGHPFAGVQLYLYWSSTTLARITSHAWHVHLYDGHVHNSNKANTHYVWPVRGGQ